MRTHDKTIGMGEDRCFYIYADAFEHPRMNDYDFLSIEKTKIIQDRETFMGTTCALWAVYRDAVCPVSIGDVVDFPTTSAPSFGEIHRVYAVL